MMPHNNQASLRGAETQGNFTIFWRSRQAPRQRALASRFRRKAMLAESFGERFAILTSFSPVLDFASERPASNSRTIATIYPCQRNQAARVNRFGASSVSTVNFGILWGPNVVIIATSAASRPRAISIRPMRGWL
jgi:hypothetical protein